MQTLLLEINQTVDTAGGLLSPNEARKWIEKYHRIVTFVFYENPEVRMFEYDQDIVRILLEEDEKFQELYEYHGKLKEKIRDVERGVRPLDGSSLGILKKEKLLTKDKMAMMINRYRREDDGSKSPES